MRVQPSLWAYFWLIVAELAVGVSVVSGKYLADYMHPYMFIGSRFLISTVILVVAMLLTRTKVVSRYHPEGRLSRQEWGWLMAQGLTGGMLFNVFFYFGVSHTTATSAGIIGSTLPAMIAVCAYFMLKESFNFRKISALAFAILGTLIITLDNPDVGDEADVVLLGGYFGDLLVLIAMFPEALYTIFGKMLGNRVTALGAATFISAFSLTALLPFFFYGLIKTDMSLFTDTVWLVLVIGGLSGVTFFWAWGKAIVGGVSVTHAALFGGLMPVFTALIAYLFIGERFSIYSAMGMLCVFVSIGVGAGIGMHRVRSKAMLIESDSCEEIL